MKERSREVQSGSGVFVALSKKRALWTPAKKREVLWPMRGGGLNELNRELAVQAHKLSHWRDNSLEARLSVLKTVRHYE